MNEYKGKDDEVSGKTRKLPLWKSALDELREAKLGHGSNVTIPYLEELLAADRESREFNIGVSRIRRELEKDGLYLDGHGKTKTGVYTICPARENIRVAKHRQRRATDELMRGLLLLSATARAELTEEENQKLDEQASRIQLRLALSARSIQVADILLKHAPNLLEPPPA